MLLLSLRVSNISAHVLLNLLNELRKRDKMRDLLIILSFFRNEVNKFNNAGSPIIDCIIRGHMHYLKSHFCAKTARFST